MEMDTLSGNLSKAGAKPWNNRRWLTLSIVVALLWGMPLWEYLGILLPVSGQSVPVRSSDGGEMPLSGPASPRLEIAEDDVQASHGNRYPTRLALGPDGRVYVSDAKADAVFIYDAGLELVGEIDGLDRPLGVAVGLDGNVFVGNDGCDNVVVYDPQGVKVQVIGGGKLRMPNDLALDRDGRLYVADSLSDQIWIYNADGSFGGSVGAPGSDPGQLAFPAAIAIAYRGDGAEGIGELYVADQGHARIQVFDLQGNFLRAFGKKVSRAGTGWNWQGRFARLQSLAIDIHGRIHAADSRMNRVQILDADTGAYLDAYGEFGTAAGQLNLPLDLLIRDGQVVVANAENGRVETVYTIP